MSLTFDPVEHRYFYDGGPVPSVTSILSPLTDFSFVKPDVLKAAQDFGTAVHLACELDDQGDLDEEALDPALLPYLNGWRKFCADHNCKWEYIEYRVFHQSLRYAGTLDRMGIVDNSPMVIDLKTTATLYAAVGPQLAAYARALPNGELLQRAAVQLVPDGYTFKKYTDRMDWPLFCSLITLKSWCTAHGVTPKFKG